MNQFRSCLRCGIRKNLDLFYRNKTCKNRRSTICILCSKELSQRNYYKNFNRIQEQKKVYYRKNREKFLEYQKEYKQRKKNVDEIHNSTHFACFE